MSKCLNPGTQVSSLYLLNARDTGSIINELFYRGAVANRGGPVFLPPHPTYLKP